MVNVNFVPLKSTHLCCATNCDGNPCWCDHRSFESIKRDIERYLDTDYDTAYRLINLVNAAAWRRGFDEGYGKGIKRGQREVYDEVRAARHLENELKS